MNKYRKFVGIFLGIELMLIAISNVLFFIMAHINEPYGGATANLSCRL